MNHLCSFNSFSKFMNSLLLSKSKLCLFLVININFLIVFIKSFNMNSLRQYTQSDEVFPIQNLLEKIGMSGGGKKKTCCNELHLYSQVDRCHAIWLGWDHTPYLGSSLILAKHLAQSHWKKSAHHKMSKQNSNEHRKICTNIFYTYMDNWDLFLWWLIFNDNKCC